MEEFFYEIEVFRQEKGHNVIYQIFQTVWTGKRQTKYGRRLKKGLQKFWP